MIATLDLKGKFLYANPAWRQTFRLDREAPLEDESFIDIFGPGCRDEAAGLLKKAMDGITVDRAPLRTETGDGRLLELEMSLPPATPRGQTACDPVSSSRHDPAETARAPPGAAVGSEPDCRRERFGGDRDQARARGRFAFRRAGMSR